MSGNERKWDGREASDEVWSLLEEFTSTISHELRTPLAIVQLAADTVAERIDQLEPGQVIELVRTIQRNSRLAVLLLRRLELARDVELGDVSLERRRVDLAELTRETVSDLTDVLLEDHPTQVHAPTSVMVQSDPTAVREIVFNLLSNAAKYSEPHAAIEVSVEQDAANARVIVRNHGSGVAPGDTQRIFEKYERVDPRGRGVGLGLYISRGLARAHGGDLVVRPAEDEGSEFLLTLPI